MKKTLTGEWLFRAADEKDYLPAVVPGCQFLDLMRNGVIPDPFVGVNEEKVQWVHEKDYVYRKTFVLGESNLAAKAIDLVCERLDTIAEITLNGVTVGKVENCHLMHVFDVKSPLRAGDNALEIRFFSPKKYVERKRKETPTPPNSNGLDGIVHIRKPQCHFGWDWGPVLTPVGIDGDIYLDFVWEKRVEKPVVKVRKEGEAYVVEAEASGADEIRLTHPDGTIDRQTGERAVFHVEKPALWWIRELSGKDEQPLYLLEAEGKDREDRIVHGVKVGLRTIALKREKDKYGYNFQFVLNDVPVFAKGANYIPPDCFMTRFDQRRLDDLMDAVTFGNMNMLRVWGGGYYASDELLDECDRRGILVWQDCMFACQAYPFFDEGFQANVLREIAYNVGRISTHPSLALWCGNNEIEAMHLAWAVMHKYVQWTEKFFYHILPEAIAAIDDQTPYIPGSPVGPAHNKDVDADHVGDTHLWGVWHGLQPMTYYRKRMTRFCSEFGFESLPAYKTVRRYATPDEYALSSPTQRTHQKCAGGNDKMLYYMLSRFRPVDTVEDIVYLSQATQQTCIQDAVEHWRRHFGRCNGAMYWQLNDCWPTASWSSYDYYGEYKALQYAARRFNAPLTASIEDEKDKVRLIVINDYPYAKTVDVAWCVFDLEGMFPTFLRKTCTVPPLGNLAVAEMATAEIDEKRQGVAVRLYENGAMLAQKTCLLRLEKKLKLPVGDIRIAVDGDNITLHTDVYQRLVMIEDEGEGHYSDNFFDLLPGETKTVRKIGTIEGDVRVKTVATLPKSKKRDTVKTRLKVFLSARNIANALYHGKVPKPYLEE